MPNGEARPDITMTDKGTNMSRILIVEDNQMNRDMLNAASGDYEDLIKAGIIDPALVVRTALQHAASVAGLMLTTDVVVTELKDDEKPVEDAVF